MLRTITSSVGCFPNRVAIVFCTTCLGLLWASPVGAQTDGEPAGPHTWAILIGAEKYEKAPPLQFTVNDVKRLADTLVTRGGLARHRILEITDQQRDPALQPRKEALTTHLTEWLAKPSDKDSIIVYFSGHGFRDADGKLYLAPLDCDPSNPAPTGIPVEWFRGQLAACKA